MDIFSINAHTIPYNPNEGIKKEGMMDNKNSFSNCHRSSGKKEKNTNIPGASDDSDQDSSASKYVVREDKRERQDGPGGD